LGTIKKKKKTSNTWGDTLISSILRMRGKLSRAQKFHQ